MGSLLAGTLLAGIALIGPPVPAAAAGSCSITVPSRVSIAAHTTVITAYPGSDCAASDMSSAFWNVTPSNFGDTFVFFSGSLSSSYMFFAALDQVGVLRAVPDGASSSTGLNDLTQNSPAYVVKYATWAYSASTRIGAAVYVHGLFRQWSTNDYSIASGRTIYLQRYLPTGWQTMLARKTNPAGQVTVGFIQRAVFQYRWVVIENGTSWGAVSASTFR